MIDSHHGWNVSFKPIILGFVFSVILTAAAYRIVTYYHLSKLMLIEATIILACVQAILQLIFFFHLGLESKPRWNTLMFLCTVGLIVILVGGSIWIMYHLEYNAMPSMGKLRQM